MISFVSYSQNGLNNNFTPNGVLDKIFDKEGNQYTFNDILINTNIDNENRVTSIGCSNNSIFNLYFEDNSGFENNSSVENARRLVLCQVLEDLSAFLTTGSSALQITSTTKVNIWVRNINNITSSPNSVLGLATGFYCVPSSSSIGGIVDNEIWKTIHTGVDSYANVVTPLTTLGGPNSNGSGIFYHGQVAFNFNPTNTLNGFTAFNWNTNTSIDASSSQIDLYTIVLHEMLHALGFNSLINVDGISRFGSSYKYFTRYDKFLKSNSGNPLLATTASNALYNYSFNTVLNNSILRPNCTISGNINTENSIDTTICEDAIKFFGSVTSVPVYTPTCFENGSSLSHFEDQLYPNCGSSSLGNNEYFLMSNAALSGFTKRYPKLEERFALCDIGYRVNNSFGVSGAKIYENSTLYNYTGASICDGITVAGINDGRNPNNTFTFITNADQPTTIPGSIILGNDFNVTGFIDLEDITGGSSVAPSFGNATTNVTFQSSQTGIHLLRYIPINGTQQGNITYVYVYVNPVSSSSTCNAVPNSCDLVLNGNFEQNSAIPSELGQFNYACSWWDDQVGGSDYYNVNAPSNVSPNVAIPCNTYGIQNNTANSNSFSGFSSQKNMINSLLDSHEIMRTKLTTPLLAGVPYQLSFNVSLSEGTSGNPIQLQAFLSENDIPSQYTGDLDITNGIFLENSYPTTNSNNNQWDTIVFNFTSTTGGEEYLYLGGFNNVLFSSNPIISSPSEGCNFSNASGIFNNYKISYYYVDNVSIIPTDGATFTPPISLACSSSVIPDLSTYLSAVPLTGVFSGLGVEFFNNAYSFNPALSGTGHIAVTYTYTNSANCPISLISNIFVSPPSIVPTFTPVAPICIGAAYTLPETSNNGFTGTWSPGFNNSATTTYTFTPSSNSCAIPTTLTVAVNGTNAFTPTFTPIGPICPGTNFVLPTTSNNGYVGTWFPAINNMATTTYKFTPDNGQCASIVLLTVVVLENLLIISGASDMCLGTSANYTSNFPDAVWSIPSETSSIAVVDPNTGEVTAMQQGVFTITATFTNGTCTYTNSMHVTVFDPQIIPVFSFPTTICYGSILPVLPTLSDNGIPGVWNPVELSIFETTSTFEPTNNCSPIQPFTITIIQNGDLIAVDDTFYLPTNVNPQLSPTVLVNDTLDGNVLVTSNLGLVFDLINPTYGITVNTDGTLTIPPGFPAGNYTVYYTLKNDCLQSNVGKITIIVGDIVVSPIRVNMDVCYNANSQVTGQSILSEVTVGGTQATSSLVTITTVNASSGFSINPNGTINVPTSSMPGTYYLEYNICPTGSTSYGCAFSGKCYLYIATTVRANADIFYYDTFGTFIGSNNNTNSNNILTNDGYAADCGLNVPNGFGPAMGHITTPIIDQTGLAGNFFISSSGEIIAINFGTIDIGSYPFTYSFCDSNNTAICANGYGWITVLGSARMPDIKNNNPIENVTIYPNPSNGLFTLLFPNKISAATVTVFSTLGQELFSDVIMHTNEKIIDLSNLSCGTYLLQITAGELTENKLIIKN